MINGGLIANRSTFSGPSLLSHLLPHVKLLYAEMAYKYVTVDFSSCFNYEGIQNQNR